MIRMYFLAFYMLLGSFGFHAQAPCSDFNDPGNPAGNWAPAAPPNGNVSVGFGSPNALDGTQYLILKDLSGSSWYENNNDFKNIGEKFRGQCLYFDFYIENDSGFGAPYHPNITLSDGTNSTTFVATVAVTPGSGWVRIKAPIELSSGGILPSNSEGAWTMTTPNAAIFDNIMMNSTTLSITPDMTSTQQEVVYFDNICIKPCSDCNECNSNFKIQATTSTSSHITTAQVFLESTNSPSLYSVDWGDGTVSGVLTSHVYTNPGSYKVCVTQYENGKPKCTTCILFCVKPMDSNIVQKNNAASPLKDISAIAKAEIGTAKVSNYLLVPNPAKNYVDLQTNLSKKELVSVRIFDISGKVVANKSETIESGRQNIRIDTEKLIEGTYIVEIKSGDKTNSQKLLIQK
ncbi:T9SS type A sorting domain-containing protein [Chryseobacterium oryctis]|uniref:T9SS type A sorting domain-containing protein n=1 Tax=Chryseobacterium oryctis TaxID=2952618 RepID=A0ABT3HMU3_9FLAO|nr:T9SS type A sorting domain-containing protein [Chryseobacterium oryctis]MCW3161111.1 T9SS type A sorting domain-containing protein [Chryseobacterium oryctis]